MGVLGVFGSNFRQAEALLRRVAGALEAGAHTVEVFKGGGPTDTSRKYEFTAWNAVDRFALDLAAGLGHGGGQPAPGLGATGNRES